MSAILIKTICQPDCTVGILTVEDTNFRCFTLELADLNNAPNVSCIPAGTYEYFKRNSPSNGNVLELKNVVGRSNVQIHKGNFTSDILGCILVGKTIADINSDGVPDVTSSGTTLSELLNLVTEIGTITIQRI